MPRMRLATLVMTAGPRPPHKMTVMVTMLYSGVCTNGVMPGPPIRSKPALQNAAIELKTERHIASPTLPGSYCKNAGRAHTAPRNSTHAVVMTIILIVLSEVDILSSLRLSAMDSLSLSDMRRPSIISSSDAIVIKPRPPNCTSRITTSWPKKLNEV